MIHNKKYARKPGIPPGIRAIKNANLNQKEDMPKNSAIPPQTPAIIRFRRERRKGPPYLLT
jgi:hypothetical protein